jgi:hypothetical protein
MNRRDFLTRSYIGLGSVALSHLMAAESESPMAPKAPPLASKAKRCIFLFMEGGVSQMDLFEYRPALEKWAGKQIPKPAGTVGEIATFSAAPNRVIPAPFRFAQHGQSGRWMSGLLPNMATCVDDMSFIHGIKVDNNNHGPAVYHTLTGNMFPGSASVGAWITYGLGSENQNLPGFIVLGDRRGAPIGGAGVWGNGFLPAAYQGTIFRPGATPIVDLKPRVGVTPASQSAELNLLRWFNEQHAAGRSNAGELEARIAAYELAFRMQSKAPELVDITSESAATQQMYGLDDPVSEPFGRQCLLARRMVERGVRFVLALHGAGGDRWDDHGDIKGRVPKHCAEVDKPVAGLLRDLKTRGLLEETLVVWASEMGRTPFDNNLVTDKPGRDHNQYGLVVWMAGGGVRPGATHGQTDEFGLKSVGDPIPLRDVHATLQRLMGLDPDRLTYLHAGRYKKLTDIGGRIITEIVA